MSAMSGSKLIAVVLSGGRDFGRCPVASRLPAALWPVDGKSAMERLLRRLSNDDAVGPVAVCFCDQAIADRLTNIAEQNCPKAALLNEPLPRGTAGSSFDAAVATNAAPDDIMLIMSANMTSPPKIAALMKAFNAAGADLTVFFNPGGSNGTVDGAFAGIYMCRRSVLDMVPKDGYFDIKEGLIPALLGAGKVVKAARLSLDVNNFANRRQYLTAIGGYLNEQFDQKAALIDPRADIHPQATIRGPVRIAAGAKIEKDACVIGPAIIESAVVVSEAGTVIKSALWKGSVVGAGSRVERCLLDYNVRLGPQVKAQDMALTADRRCRLQEKIVNSISKVKKVVPQMTQNQKNSGPAEQPAMTVADLFADKWRAAVAGGLLLAVFMWSFWPNIRDLWQIWQRSDEYSIGLIVPILVAYIFWARREYLGKIQIKPAWILGSLVRLAAVAVRSWGQFLMFGSAERFSIGLTAVAIIMLILGLDFARRSWSILLFLFLMFPWPNRLQTAITNPLQRWATASSVFSLEMLGYDVVQEGNIIHIGDATVAIAEACNGLRMVTAFIVITSLVALIVNRAWWEKAILLGASLPIALLCNTIRLTVTSIAFTFIHTESWQEIFHDFGGYAMMPVGLAATVGLLGLLKVLTTEEDQPQQLVTHNVRKKARQNQAAGVSK